jgi:tetratricopeptide (TPR) repeat protein
MATSDDSSPRPETAAPVETGFAPRPRLLRALARGALVAGLFLGGLTASWGIRAFVATGCHAVHSPAEGDTSRMAAASAERLAEVLARGDAMLVDHRFAEALWQYGDILSRAPKSAAIIQYRVGLCQESLGHSDHAIANYRDAITAADSPILAFAGRLAMSRCLLMSNSLHEARQILYPVLLNESRQRGIPAPFFAEARSLIALSLARETHPMTPDRHGLERLATFMDIAASVPFYLDETARPIVAAVEGEAAVKVAPIVVEPGNGEKLAFALHVEQYSQSPKELLERLASDARWRSEWTPAALEKIASRVIDLDVRDWTLLELLELTADHLDLVCRLENDVLFWSTRAELDSIAMATVKHDMAQRALESAILADPTQRLAHAVALELANGHAVANRFPEAMTWYDRLIRDESSGHCVALAYYNRAQLHVRKQASLLARRDFYRVIDQASGHEIALRALLRLGQLALESDANEALPLFRRARTLAPASPYQSLAALNLAATLLSLDQPDQARAVLHKQRGGLQQTHYKPIAAFLDVYASYQSAKSTKLSRRDTTDLLSVLGQNQDSTVLGPFGQGLIADAYDGLGLPEHAERALRHAVATVNTKTALAARFELKLGEALVKQDQADKAQPYFEKVALTSFSERTLARFHLARFDLQEKRFEQCAERCRQLWEEKTFKDQNALLQMWGYAFEGMRDFDRAAQCFAGKAPTPHGVAP